MFNKNTKISFIIDKDNSLYIDIVKNKKDPEAYLKIARLITMVESGELHTQILMAINSCIKNSPMERDSILDILKENLINRNVVENKVKSGRNPIISPDVVLTTFRSNINT